MLIIRKPLFATGRMRDVKRQKRALALLSRRRFSPFLMFGIFLPQNDSDLCEIIPFNELRKSWYHDTDMTFTMIGIADTAENAVRVAVGLYLARERIRKEDRNCSSSQ